MNIPDEEHVIVGSIAASKDKRTDQRIAEVLSICQVINAHPVLITDKPQPFNEDIPCVCIDELHAMRTPKDLLASA
jgi:predicted transcriptional regulator